MHRGQTVAQQELIPSEPEDDRLADVVHLWSTEGDGTPIIGPDGAAAETDQLVAVPRLARHEIVLDDDHRVGVAVCGRGLAVGLVGGFSAGGVR
jgi:hypothetical protein